jgi:hypothetical protein
MYYSCWYHYTKAGDLSFISMALEVITLAENSGSVLNRMESADVSQWPST